jgi:hypothetical protein
MSVPGIVARYFFEYRFLHSIVSTQRRDLFHSCHRAFREDRAASDRDDFIIKSANSTDDFSNHFFFVEPTSVMVMVHASIRNALESSLAAEIFRAHLRP